MTLVGITLHTRTDAEACRCFSVRGLQKMTYEVLCANSPPGIPLTHAACDAKRLQMCPFSPNAPPQRVRTPGLNAIKPGGTHKAK